jgi:hypothetical protein
VTVAEGSARRAFLREVFGGLAAAGVASRAVKSAVQTRAATEAERKGSIRITRLETLLVNRAGCS